jgi:hypothetical protein
MELSCEEATWDGTLTTFSLAFSPLGNAARFLQDTLKAKELRSLVHDGFSHRNLRV